MTNKSNTKELCANKKARFEYEILETYEVGICLLGTEIKSLRDHGGSLLDSYIAIEKKELWLVGAQISPYRFGNIHNHPEKRKRKLLAHKKEIKEIQAEVQEKGLTCIPLSIYLKEGKAKLKIALARGKKLHDKRETIKTRDQDRQIRRLMKS